MKEKEQTALKKREIERDNVCVCSRKRKRVCVWIKTESMLKLKVNCSNYAQLKTKNIVEN